MWKETSSGGYLQQQAVCWRTLSELIEPYAGTMPQPPKNPSLCHGPAIGIEFQAAREEADGQTVLKVGGNCFPGMDLDR